MRDLNKITEWLEAMNLSVEMIYEHLDRQDEEIRQIQLQLERLTRLEEKIEIIKQFALTHRTE